MYILHLCYYIVEFQTIEIAISMSLFLENSISTNLHMDCLVIIMILHIYRLIKASSLVEKLGY